MKEGESNFSSFLCRGHSGHSGVQPERRRAPEAQESLQRNHLQVFGGAGGGSASLLGEAPPHRACEAALERAALGSSRGAGPQETSCTGQCCRWKSSGSSALLQMWLCTSRRVPNILNSCLVWACLVGF